MRTCMYCNSAVDSGQWTVYHTITCIPATCKCSYSTYMHVQTLKITSTISCNMRAQVANPRYATVQLMIYALSQAAQDKINGNRLIYWYKWHLFIMVMVVSEVVAMEINFFSRIPHTFRKPQTKNQRGCM